MSDQHDVVIVGGGVVGLSSALALARRGASVCVIERASLGGEASAAAAGILGAQVEPAMAGPLGPLGFHSRALYPAFARGLLDATGVDPGYERCGVLKAVKAEDVESFYASLAWQDQAGLAPPRLDRAGLLALAPGLGEVSAAGAWFEGDGQVDPRALLLSLAAALRGAGADLREGVACRRVAIEAGRAVGVELATGQRVSGGAVVLSAGSWASQIEGLPGEAREVAPVRGQVLELVCEQRPFQPVIYGPGAYLVPRADGRVLVGSTMEQVGFDKRVTARGAHGLLSAALAIWPALAGAELRGMWAGLRPQAPRLLLGPSSVRGLILALGHHRNGILLAPASAEVVAAACEGKSYPIPPLGPST